jgi:hypothetical protein
MKNCNDLTQVELALRALIFAAETRHLKHKAHPINLGDEYLQHQLNEAKKIAAEFEIPLIDVDLNNYDVVDKICQDDQQTMKRAKSALEIFGIDISEHADLPHISTMQVENVNQTMLETLEADLHESILAFHTCKPHTDMHKFYTEHIAWLQSEIQTYKLT